MPPLNHSLKKLYCSENKLTSLPHLNDLLIKLCCFNNQLTFLPPLNYSLIALSCFNNPLNSLPDLNDDVMLCWDNTPINTILNENKNNINKWNNFRNFYFHLKFKKKIISWMWKSREKRNL